MSQRIESLGVAPGGEVIVGIDGVLVLAHSQKEHAAATRRKAFGPHPLFAFVDHGRAGSGELVGALLRPGPCGWPTDAGPPRRVGLSSLAVATNGRLGAG
ncbi:hypothetical protein ACIGJO_08555 [Streptomyces sp. NPDC079020]|uniref:hypothetical protein n=1 Tax=Streptomyces sp. NPDC079020 TaxID=3365722 RepID=UPI0037D2A731